MESASKIPIFTVHGISQSETGCNDRSIVHKFWFTNHADRLLEIDHVNSSANNGNIKDCPECNVNGDKQEPLSNNDFDKKLDAPRIANENDDLCWLMFCMINGLVESIVSEYHKPRSWSWTNAVSIPACAK